MSALRTSSYALLISGSMVYLSWPSEPSMRLLPDLVAAAVSSSELSGLEASRAHQGVYWTHNDSGDDARLFVFDADGNELCPAGTDADVSPNGERLAVLVSKGGRPTSRIRYATPRPCAGSTTNACARSPNTACGSK